MSVIKIATQSKQSRTEWNSFVTMVMWRSPALTWRSAVFYSLSPQTPQTRQVPSVLIAGSRDGRALLLPVWKWDNGAREADQGAVLPHACPNTHVQWASLMPFFLNIRWDSSTGLYSRTLVFIATAVNSWWEIPESGIRNKNEKVCVWGPFYFWVWGSNLYSKSQGTNKESLTHKSIHFFMTGWRSVCFRVLRFPPTSQRHPLTALNCP